MTLSPARLLIGVLSVVALIASPFAAIAVQPGSATATVASQLKTVDYPSWGDVTAAKANQAATEAAVANITSILTGLEATATTLSNAALARGEEYLVANYNLQAATATATEIAHRADAATASAEKMQRQVGAFAAQLSKAGGDTSVNLLLSGNQAENLLYRLGAMSQLTSQTAGMRDAAAAAANSAQSLKDQSAVALTERDRLSREAEAGLAAAQAAQSAAAAQVAEQRARSAVLYDQLAALKNTTAAVEKSYQAGIDEAAAAAARAAAAGSGNSTGGTDTSIGSGANGGTGSGSSWVPSSDSIASPAEARSIASGMIGSYGWGGDQFSCLVQLWNGESGWRVNAYNPSSGAYGIPQSWPANKMASVADDWPTSAQTQLTWGMNYIRSAYGSPCAAWDRWQARSPHWY